MSLNLAKLYISFLVLFLLSAGTRVRSAHVYYDFTVAYVQGSPDGVPVDILAVNGKFPGPEIRCKLGDTVHVLVRNQIRDRQLKTHHLSVHWHGLLQAGTIYADGPDHVTQCPIPYGGSYNYEFQVNQTGTYWWHSHAGYQYSEGMWGAFIVENPDEPYKLFYDKELTLTLNDWYHTSGKSNTDWYLSSQSGGRSPIPDSAMINGRGFYPCSIAAKKGLPCTPQNPHIFEVRRNDRYRIRIINTSTLVTFQFFIQEHLRFYVVEVDGVDTVPVPCATLLIAPGQRYSIIVNMVERPGSFEEQLFLIHANVANVFNTTSPNSNLYPDVINRYSGQPAAILKYKSVWNNFWAAGDEGEPYGPIARQASFGPSVSRIWPAGASPQEQLSYFIQNPQALRPGQQATLPSSPPTSLRPDSTGYPADFTIQVAASPSFSSLLGKVPITAIAAAAESSFNSFQPWVVLNEKDLQPYDRIPAPINVDRKIRLSIDVVTHPITKITSLTFNKNAYNVVGTPLPVFFQMQRGQTIPKNFNPIPILYNQVIEVEIVNNGALPHPFHLHGHTFWVSGSGKIGGSVNLYPMGARRDTVVVDGFSRVFIRFVADNPGAWLFHCHINWHHQAGLAAVFIEAQDHIKIVYPKSRIPQTAKDSCRAFGHYL